jgi:hypothetical protein
MEAIEELNAMLPVLETFAAEDTYSADVIRTAKEKIVKAEANVPQAKIRYESSVIIEKIRSLLPKLDVRCCFGTPALLHSSHSCWMNVCADVRPYVASQALL